MRLGAGLSLRVTLPRERKERFKSRLVRHRQERIRPRFGHQVGQPTKRHLRTSPVPVCPARGIFRSLAIC